MRRVRAFSRERTPTACAKRLRLPAGEGAASVHHLDYAVSIDQSYGSLFSFAVSHRLAQAMGKDDDAVP